jgi:hypothetical protein
MIMSKIMTAALIATVLAASAIPIGIANASPDERDSNQTQPSGKQKSQSSGKQKPQNSDKQSINDREFWEQSSNDREFWDKMQQGS